MPILAMFCVISSFLYCEVQEVKGEGGRKGSEEEGGVGKREKERTERKGSELLLSGHTKSS